MREFIFFILAGYLLGSIRFGYLLPRWFCHVDVTEVSDDGNPGAANAFKYGGAVCGIAVLLGDLCKGYLPVRAAALAGLPGETAFALVMAAPVVGHAWPFLRWKKGGKAIAVSFGVLVGLFPFWRPLWTLVAYYLLFSLVIVIRPHLHRSIITFSLFALTVFLTVPVQAVVTGCALISVIVVVRHAVKYQGEKMEYELSWKRKA